MRKIFLDQIDSTGAQSGQVTYWNGSKWIASTVAISDIEGLEAALGTKAPLDGANLTPQSVAATGTITGSNLSGSNTGDQLIILTGDVTGQGGGSFATTIGANKITNAKLSTVSSATFKGRISASTGNVEDLTTAQATSMLNTFTATLKGLVPPPTSSTGKFLRDDGTWATVTQSSGGAAEWGQISGALSDQFDLWTDLQAKANLSGAAFTGSITVTGNIEGTGHLSAATKSFLIDHPTKPGMKLQHGSLEGPEFGVYIRGSSRTGVITLPDYWSGLVDLSTITVSCTPNGRFQKLYVANVTDTEIVIKNARWLSKLDFDYIIFAKRKDIPDLVPEK